MYKLLIFSIIIFSFFACQQNQSLQKYTAAQIDSLSTLHKKHIESIENSFLTEKWSPLTEEDKQHSAGLKYFPYDVSWRFQGSIHKYENPDSLIIRGSKAGDERPAVKFGYFEFKKDNQPYRLEIIKIFPTRPGRQAHLFLGFWDATNDVETYGGGRYIDIEENDENYYTVDFNYAYNPYCAYSARYSCAIPPFENRLKLKITAGEMKFKEDH